jgi:hypothetical protein
MGGRDKEQAPTGGGGGVGSYLAKEHKEHSQRRVTVFSF